MNTQTAPRSTGFRSNILGVTGLSRPVIAALYRSRGLFGRDSQVGEVEQAVIENRLPAIPGIVRRSAIHLQTPALKALADYVDALIAAGDAAEARRRALAAGVSRAAVIEAAITVDNLRVVFGPFAAPVAVTVPQAASAYARAA